MRGLREQTGCRLLYSEVPTPESIYKNAPDAVGDNDVAAGAGGGGGGSNLVPEGGTATLDDSGVPSIVISYQGGLGEEPPTEPEDKQACKKGRYDALGFKNQGQCIKAVNAKN